MTRLHLFSSLLLFAGLAVGLEVSPNSPCAKRCMDNRDNDPVMRNSSLTWNTDLSCFDWEYIGDNAMDTGKKFADCNRCMQSSEHEDVESGERDTVWFMFNNRAVVDWCIFGRFAEENNSHLATTYPYQQCNAKCELMYAAADYKIKENPGGYAYCDSEGANFTADAEECTSCLYGASGLTVLGNILTTVAQMCKSKPGIVLDLGFDADIYTASRLQVENTTSPIPSASSSSPTSNGTPAYSTSNPPPPPSSSTGISKGAIAGIALGALVGILFFLRWLKNKRQVAQIGGNSETWEHKDSSSAGHLSGHGRAYEADGQSRLAEMGEQGRIHEIGPGERR